MEFGRQLLRAARPLTLLLALTAFLAVGCDEGPKAVDPNKNPNYKPGPEEGKAKDNKGGFVPDFSVDR